jgi:GTP-binding protein HflX
LEPRRRDTRSDRLSPTGSATGRALVIEPVLRTRTAALAPTTRSPRQSSTRRSGLPRAIDLEVEQSGIVMLARCGRRPISAKARSRRLPGLVKTHEAGIVVMDCALSPVQQRNLEKAWGAKVLDRTGLILEIFGRRARTREGALQVEHAHLTYQKSRLVRSWTHLERQRGGFGFLGGPGETQLEADRRMIEERLAKIEGELVKVKRTRELHRESRRRVPYPIVALVGYTNAGKSTLFNRMTQAKRAFRRHAVRHARSDLACGRSAARRAHHPVRHRRLHLRPADHADRGVPRHAGRGDRSRRDPCTCATSRMRTPRRNCTTSKKSCASSASIRRERSRTQTGADRGVE